MERLVRVHALGTVATTTAAWEALRASRGRVVNVTSGAVFGLPGSTVMERARPNESGPRRRTSGGMHASRTGRRGPESR